MPVILPIFLLSSAGAPWWRRRGNAKSRSVHRGLRPRTAIWIAGPSVRTSRTCGLLAWRCVASGRPPAVGAAIEVGPL